MPKDMGTFPTYGAAAAEAVRLSMRDPRHGGRARTFWVTLQPRGWAITRGRKCPDIRSVPVLRVRDGTQTEFSRVDDREFGWKR